MSISILASLTGLGADRAVMDAAVAAAKINGGHVLQFITKLSVRILIVEADLYCSAAWTTANAQASTRLN